MELTKEIIIEKIKQDWNKIEDFGVKNLWLFGSYAQNKQDQNSDIDFLVEFKSNFERKYNHLRKLSIYLEELFNKRIDMGLKTDIEDLFKESILNNNLVEVTI